MTLDEVIKYFGQAQLAARAINVSNASLSHWKHREKRIPLDKQVLFEQYTRGKLKVDRIYG